MEIVFDYPENMTKSQALVRRSNKLISWLRRDECAIYVDENSVVELKKLIKYIIHALEQSINPEDWREFLLLFQESRKYLIFEQGREPEMYAEAVNALISGLESYQGYVEDNL